MTKPTRRPTRPETGPMQFGDDWPGTFIRGDNAAFYANSLRAVLRDLDAGKQPSGMELGALRGLLEDLVASRVMPGNALSELQRMNPFEECRNENDVIEEAFGEEESET